MHIYHFNTTKRIKDGFSPFIKLLEKLAAKLLIEFLPASGFSSGGPRDWCVRNVLVNIVGREIQRAVQHYTDLPAELGLKDIQ